MSKTSTTTPMPGMASPTSFSSSSSSSKVVTLCSPEMQTGVRSASPNYFSLSVDPDSEHRDSIVGAMDNRSSPTSSTRSFPDQTPMVIGRSANPEFEAIRAQANAAYAYNPGRSSLHNISTPVIKTPLEGPQKMVKEDDKMDLDEERDSAYESADSSRASTRASMNTPSFFDLPRQASPASMIKRMSPPPMARSILSRLEDRHPRLSLPSHRAEPPSPRANDVISQPRADTLPSMLEAGPTMIQPSVLRDLIEKSPSQLLMILDLRVAKLFADSRVRGALNLCLPTTLLKRASFNLQKITDTFGKVEDRQRFLSWKQCQYIIVYDVSSSSKTDATTGVFVLNKFTAEGFTGRTHILKGGFNGFSKAFPQSLDRGSNLDTRPSRMNLSLGTTMPAVAPVAGGCEMPGEKSAANPFFSNIRQKQDLIGGVGQIEVKRPEELNDQSFNTLPRWLHAAASPVDQGKKVSDKFHKIELAEEKKMEKAFSDNISYGTPDEKSKARIAGFEKGSKNRYNNIWPFEHARVKLSATSDDYFNASHITSSRSDKAYIAAQGPLPTTYVDFWSVIWDHDVRVIVMLTAESEGGQLKCHNYWSDKNFGPFILKRLSEKRFSLDAKGTHNRHGSTATGPQPEPASAVEPAEQDPFKFFRRRAMTNIDDFVHAEGSAETSASESPYAIVRKFTLAHSGLPFSPLREITQVHYQSWPDFGTPAQPAQVLALVELCGRLSAGPVIGENVKMKNPGEKLGQRPVLVHCSAGCGRTGTFCTIDSVLDMLKKQAKHRQNRVSSSTRDQKKASSRLMPLDELSPTSTMDFFSSKVSVDSRTQDETEERPKNEDWLCDEDTDLVEQTVTEFREQRMSMVQSLKQYVLCYETLLEWFVQAPARPGNLPRRQSGL